MSDTDGSLIELRAQQASKRPFPPRCPVLCVTDTTITKGTVARIFIDISSLKRSFVYHVTTEQDTVVAAREEQLQWAPGCPVWLYPTSGPIWKECTILTSYQKYPKLNAVFSVQQDSDGSLFHGYPKEFIRYRGLTEPPHDVPVTTEAKEKWFDASHVNETEVEYIQNVPDSAVTPLATKDKANVEDTKNDTMIALNNGTETCEPSSKAPAGQHSNKATKATSHATKRPAETVLAQNESSPKRATRTPQGRFQPAPQVPKQMIVSERQLSETRQEEQTNPNHNVATYSFLLPDRIFRNIDDMKDFYREYCPAIARESGSQIRLLTEKVQGKDRIWFDVTGTPEQRLDSFRRLEESLVSITSGDMKEQALYCLAWLNGESIDKIVYRYHPFSRRKRKQWMFSRRFPLDIHDFEAHFHDQQSWIERQSGCSLSLHIECEDPHFVIYGDSVDKVQNCIQLINASLNECRDYKRLARKHRFA